MLRRIITTLAFGLLAVNSTFAENACIAKLEKHIHYPDALDLDHCKLTDDDMRAMVQFLNAHAFIKALWASDNQLTSDSLDVLNQAKNLTFIRLSHNKIDDAGAYRLAEMKTLTVIDLSHNQLGDQAGAAFANNPRLIGIDFSYNRISDISAHALGSIHSLKYLKLQHNKIGDAGAMGIAENQTIEQLDLSNNQLTDHSAQALASMPAMEYLDLNNNRLTDQGGIILAQSKTHYHGLMLLGNAVGDETARAIVATHRRLMELGLSPNVTDAGAALLAHADIMILDLQNNHISDEGVKSLALKPNSYRFDLAGNPITDVGAYALSNTKVRLDGVNLSATQISDAGAMALINRPEFVELSLSHDNLTNQTAMVAANRKEELLLDVGYNHFSPSAVKALQANPNLGNLVTKGNDGVDLK